MYKKYQTQIEKRKRIHENLLLEKEKNCQII